MMMLLLLLLLLQILTILFSFPNYDTQYDAITCCDKSPFGNLIIESKQCLFDGVIDAEDGICRGCRNSGEDHYEGKGRCKSSIAVHGPMIILNEKRISSVDEYG